MIVKSAEAGDLEALQKLRNHYVAHSFSTFDEELLSGEAIQSWFGTFRPDGPHRLLVACENEELLGFCSSQAYRSHPAFRRTVETSIYVAPSTVHGGIGSALYTRLFAELTNQGLHRAVVGIALPNEASVRLHSKFGYKTVGVFSEYAQKNGRFISSQWMERAL
jgi:phosphinothricin acetyltransferase